MKLYYHCARGAAKAPVPLLVCETVFPRWSLAYCWIQREKHRVERAGPGLGRAMGGSPKSNGESDDEEEVLMVAPNYALGARSGGMSPNENPPRDVARALGLSESTDEVLMIRPPLR